MKARMSRLYLIVSVFVNLTLLLGILLLLALLDNYLNAFIIPIPYKTHLIAYLIGRWIMLILQAILLLIVVYWINRLLLPRLSVQYPRLITGALFVVIFLVNTLYILRSYSILQSKI